jgi:hypothetical protein
MTSGRRRRGGTDGGLPVTGCPGRSVGDGLGLGGVGLTVIVLVHEISICRLAFLASALPPVSSLLEYFGTKVRAVGHAMSLELVSSKGGVSSWRLTPSCFSGLLVAAIRVQSQHATDGPRLLRLASYRCVELHAAVLRVKLHQIIHCCDIVGTDCGIPVAVPAACQSLGLRPSRLTAV